MRIFYRLGWFFRQEKWAYLSGIFTLIFVAVTAAVVPMIIGHVIDAMTTGSLTMSQLWLWIFMVLSITLLQYGLRYFWRVQIFGTSAKLELQLRRKLFHHFTQMDAVFFQSHRTGDLMAHATNDLQAIRMVAAGGILTLVDSLSEGLLTLGMMFFAIDWRLSLVTVLPLPILAIAIRFIGQAVHTRFRKAQEAFSSLNDKVQESITGMKVIKTFGEEQLELEDFKKMTAEVVDKNIESVKYGSMFRPMIQAVAGISTLIGVFVGGYFVMNGEITVGLLIAFLSYIRKMAWPMIAIGELINILERGAASYDRVEQLLKEKSHIKDDQDASSMEALGNIEVNIEQFRYPSETHQIALQKVQFTLPKGKTLGVVGKTGAGKSTLFKLLLREYDYYQGSIRYNGHSLKDYTLDSVLAKIGYVPQDNFLFSTTVRDNIRFGVPNASSEEVNYVAQLTDVHDDILAFTDGYDTMVGERGVSLSGGQKQRIAIARALLLAPELLILDDSLSAVDAKTEERILTALKETRKDKTTIISAHRISSVMHADEIIVLDNGTISERGTHEQLLAQNGWYKEMYDKQQLEQALTGGVSHE